MKEIKCGNTTLTLDESTLRFHVSTHGIDWHWTEDYIPRLQTAQGTVPFSSASVITHRLLKTGFGEGIVSHYEGFSLDGRDSGLAFDTLVWIEAVSESVYFEWIPLAEDSLSITEVFWPGCFAFDEKREDWYTLLNLQQGLLIPNSWDVPLPDLPFDGRMCTSAAYMPWFSQIKGRSGYLAICKQPWDAAYYASHPAGGPYTHVGIRWLPSLGKMHTRRTMRYSFLPDCDYNTICKCYLSYVKEKGSFRSLKEKRAKAPVEKLIGTAFVHTGIKTQVMPDSRFFDPEAPDKNNRLTSFETRTAQIRHYHDDLKVERLYLHLDGWAQPGYDNQHPDYLPACLEAGGWEKMKELADTIHSFGYQFGIHDQYRDYYFAAPSFDASFGTLLPDGTLPEHSNWAGGRQTYLCAVNAPFYVKRNFTEIKKNGISLDCAYLDVFTCNEPDECCHPHHMMTRRECLDYRSQCFEYLLSKGILPSSEEATDWSIGSLVFCHYAPYDFMMRQPGSPRIGIPVPLFNLVYHDCLIIPWMMEKYPDEDLMLYALLNGGAPYFIRDGAYADTDGSFRGHILLSEMEMAERCSIVTGLHKKIAECEMLSHAFIDGQISRQKTTFSNGITVEINLDTQKYVITVN